MSSLGAGSPRHRRRSERGAPGLGRHEGRAAEGPARGAGPPRAQLQAPRDDGPRPGLPLLPVGDLRAQPVRGTAPGPGGQAPAAKPRHTAGATQVYRAGGAPLRPGDCLDPLGHPGDGAAGQTEVHLQAGRAQSL